MKAFHLTKKFLPEGPFQLPEGSRNDASNNHSTILPPQNFNNYIPFNCTYNEEFLELL